MSDIISFATTGVTYRTGSTIVSANKLGSIQKLLPRIEHNVVTSQSGIMDDRLDKYCYYVTNPYSRIQ